NRRDPKTALDNAADAIRRKVDLYIQYHHDATTNATIGARLHAASIPVLAINFPVPDAPLYTADNTTAGRIAGEALGEVAARAWRDRPVFAVIIRNVRPRDDRPPERIQGVVVGLPLS